jgi:beta-lactamase regulating signal transducer with metallopeptidase domain
MIDLLWWLGQNTVVVALLILPVLLACRLFCHRPAVQHLLWVVVLLKFVTPPIVVWPLSLADVRAVVVESEFDAPRQVQPVPASPDHVAEPAAVAAVSELPNIAIAPAKTPRFPIVQSIVWGVSTIWLGGAVVMLLAQLRMIHRHSGLIRSGGKPPTELLELVDTTARNFGLRPPRISTVAGVTSPMIWCLGRAMLLWPESFSSPEDCRRMQSVIAHEMAHLKRCDHWITWLDLAARIVWWWNPLYWFVSFRIRESAEMACDALAIASSDDKRADYAKLLLEISTGFQTATPAPVLGVGTGNKASFERRLAMILSERVSGGRPLWSVFLAVALAMSALPAWSLAQQKEAGIPNEEKKRPEAEKTGDAKEQGVTSTADKEEKTITITATVVDDLGQPVAGARIWWESDGDRREPPVEAASDDAGKFSLSFPEERLEPWGHLWVFKANKQLVVVQTWRKEGETALTLRRTLISRDPSGRHMAEELPDGVIRLEPSIDKSYRILTPDGSPAIGIEVEPLHYLTASNSHNHIPVPLRGMLTVKTDAEGIARFPNLTPEWFNSLDIHSTDWGKQHQSRLNDARGAPVGDTIQLKAPGRIEGQLEASHPEWTRGATLTFETVGTGTTGSATVTSDENGRFSVPSIVPGKLVVRCKLAEGVPALPRLPTDQRVAEGETLSLKIKLSPSVVVRGIVRTQDTQAPVSGAEISIGFGTRQYAHAVSDADGRYEARVLLGKISNMSVVRRPREFLRYKVSGGTHEKEVIVDDYEAPFELPPLELVPLVRIAGVALDEEGLPIPDVFVRGIQKDRHSLDAAKATNKLGEFELWVPKDISLDEVIFNLQGATPYQRPTVEPGDPIVFRAKKLNLDFMKRPKFERPKRP